MTSVKDSGAYVTIKYGQNQFDAQSVKYRTCFDLLHILLAIKIFTAIDLILILGIIIFSVTDANESSAWLTLIYTSPVFAVLSVGAALIVYGLQSHVRYYFLPHLVVKILDALGLLVILGILLFYEGILIEQAHSTSRVENRGLDGRLCAENETTAYCATTFKIYTENGKMHSSYCKVAVIMVLLNSIRFFFGLWVTRIIWRSYRFYYDKEKCEVSGDSFSHYANQPVRVRPK